MEELRTRVPSPLCGKTLYGFGDSLVYGHYMEIGMLDYVAEKHGMIYRKFAVNGASVIPGIAGEVIENENGGPELLDVPDIGRQIEMAPAAIPDFVCFDGYTNDAYESVLTRHAGRINGCFDGNYDRNTFEGAFETICWCLKTKYRGSRLIYICPHKMPSRNAEVQDYMQRQARAICRKWKISCVDIYNRGKINTNIPEMRSTYSYNLPGETCGGNGTHLNEEGYRLWYAPMIEVCMRKLCK